MPVRREDSTAHEIAANTSAVRRFERGLCQSVMNRVATPAFTVPADRAIGRIDGFLVGRVAAAVVVVAARVAGNRRAATVVLGGERPVRCVFAVRIATRVAALRVVAARKWSDWNVPVRREQSCAVPRFEGTDRRAARPVRVAVRRSSLRSAMGRSAIANAIAPAVAEASFASGRCARWAMRDRRAIHCCRGRHRAYRARLRFEPRRDSDSHSSRPDLYRAAAVRRGKLGDCRCRESHVVLDRRWFARAARCASLLVARSSAARTGSCAIRLAPGD